MWWGKSEHGAWFWTGELLWRVLHQTEVTQGFQKEQGISGRQGEGDLPDRGSLVEKGDTEEIRGHAVHLAVLTFAALVGKVSQRKHPQQPAARRAWENRGGDNRRLGALSSKCKLSHLSAINQEVYGAMIFALQLKNHKAGTLSGCGKQNSRVSTAAAVNQLLLTSCCPALRWGVYSAPNGKQDRRRKWDWHQRTARRAAATRVQFIAQAPFGAWENIFDKPNWQLRFVFLHSHVTPNAIHYNTDMEMTLVVKVEDKLPVEASGPPCAPRVAHLGTGQSWSLPQPFWCLLTFWWSLSQPRIQIHMRLHRAA